MTLDSFFCPKTPEGYETDTEIKQSTITGAKRGAFSKVFRKKKQFISRYIGQKYTRKEKDRKWPGKDTLIPYGFDLSDGSVIVPSDPVTHSIHGGGPFINSIATPGGIRLNGQPRSNVALWGSSKPKKRIYVTKQICPGEEILTRYGNDYWLAYNLEHGTNLWEDQNYNTSSEEED